MADAPAAPDLAAPDLASGTIGNVVPTTGFGGMPGSGAPGGSPYFPTTTPQQEQQVISDVKKATQEKLGADNAQEGQFRRNEDRYHERMAQMEGRQSHELDELNKWDAKGELQKREVSIWEQFGQPAFVLSMLASAFSAKPMNSALMAGGEAMTALKENRMQDYQRAFDAWKANTDLAVKRFNMEHDLHSEYAEDWSKDMEAARIKASNAATRFGDKKALAFLNAGMYGELLDYKEKEARTLKDMTAAHEQIYQANVRMRVANAAVEEAGIDPKKEPLKALQIMQTATSEWEHRDDPVKRIIDAGDKESLRVNGRLLNPQEINVIQAKQNELKYGAKGNIVDQEIRHRIDVSDAAAPVDETELARSKRHEQIIREGRMAGKGVSATGVSPEELQQLGWNDNDILQAANTYNKTGVLPKLGTTRSYAGPINTAIIHKADDLLAADGKTSDDRNMAALEYKAQGKAISAWMAPGTTSNRVTYLGVAVDHLDTLRQLDQALKKSDKPRFEAVAQRWAIENGKAAPTNLETAASIVGPEITKAITASGAGALADRLEQTAHFKRIASHAQMDGAITTTEQLLGGQLHGLKRQFLTETHLPETTFNSLVGPHALDVLSRASGGQSEQRQRFKRGEVRNGYRLEGDDDTDPNNWKKIQ